MEEPTLEDEIKALLAKGWSAEDICDEAFAQQDTAVVAVELPIQVTVRSIHLGPAYPITISLNGVRISGDEND